MSSTNVDQFASAASTGVVRMGGQLEVFWSHAKRVVANMVDLEACRDWANQVLISPAVGQHGMNGVLRSSRTKAATGLASATLLCATPNPAGVGLFNLRPKALLLAEFWKALCASVFPPHHVVVAAHASPARRVRLITPDYIALHPLIIHEVIR